MADETGGRVEKDKIRNEITFVVHNSMFTLYAKFLRSEFQIS